MAIAGTELMEEGRRRRKGGREISPIVRRKDSGLLTEYSRN